MLFAVIALSTGCPNEILQALIQKFKSIVRCVRTPRASKIAADTALEMYELQELPGNCEVSLFVIGCCKTDNQSDQHKQN
jgi:hypothetical protein